MRAGIPILEAVRSLGEESKGNVKKVLLALEQDLESGKVIHQSFARFPRSFDKVTVNLIKAAEEAGNLETSLNDIKEGIQREMEFNDKLKSALTYPIFVLMVFVGVLLMMLVVVLPRIAQVFNRLGTELPLATKILIYFSGLVINQWPIILVILGLLVAGFMLLLRYQRTWLYAILFSVPYVSGLVRQIDLSRFSRSMHLLLESGLPIVTALELAEEVMVKPEMKGLVRKARLAVPKGEKFSAGLAGHTKLVPGTIVKLIEVGEKSGSLSKSMEDISKNLDYQVTRNLETFTALLEPIMLVFVGLVIGGMMLSIIGPIYGLISAVQVR